MGQRFSCDEEVKSAVRKWFQKQNNNFLSMHFKNYCSVGGSVLKCVVTLYKNNYAALKIIDVGIFLFYFIKISFPVHFLFKWRQNLSAHPHTEGQYGSKGKDR